MAEQQENIEEVKGNGKTKLLLIIVIILLLLVIGLAAMIFLGKQDSADTEPPPKQAPIYYTVETPFIVNFSEQSNGAVRFLQIKMKVMARDKAVIDVFSQSLPAIQHDLLLLFYSQKYDVLQTEGTEALQQATLDKINAILMATPLMVEDDDEPKQLENGLEAVYFTSFLMQ